MTNNYGRLSILITPLAIAMSLYHIHIAWTGGYEPNFQRSLSYFFGLALIFLVYRNENEQPINWLLTGALFLLAVVSIGVLILMVILGVGFAAAGAAGGP